MSVKARIFGSQYTFEGDDSERISLLADYVDRKMAETADNIKNVTTSKVAVITAMQIANELFSLRESLDQTTDDYGAHLDRLITASQELLTQSQEASETSRKSQ